MTYHHKRLQTRPSEAILGAIACLSIADMEANFSGFEPIYVPKPGNPDLGWIK
ncbi:MAG: hypothetical protein F6K10_05730 [Moorea sp. SIO2B7]|nr:hypothetical protein [Moorena sp. SIO2B7]